MITREDSIRLIISETGRLKQYINGLNQDDLRKPTPCEDWDVGELIAHLVWFAQNYRGLIERGLRGDLSIPDGFQDTPVKGPAISRAYSNAAVAMNQSLGQELLLAFGERFDKFNDLLRGLGADDWAKPYYHPYLANEREIDSILAVIIQEIAIHEWDIRSSVETSSAISAECVPILMEKLPSNRRPWNSPFRIAATADEPIIYGFQLDAAWGGIDIVVAGEKARLESTGGFDAHLKLNGTASSFVLLMYGRLTLDSAITANQFDAQGDLGLVPQFDRWLDTDG